MSEEKPKSLDELVAGAIGAQSTRRPQDDSVREDVAEAWREHHQLQSASSDDPHGPIPRSWREAWPLVVWTIFVFSFGLVAVEKVIDGDFYRAGASFAVMVVLLAMLIWWRYIRALFLSRGGWAVVVSLVVLFLAVSPILGSAGSLFRKNEKTGSETISTPRASLSFTPQEIDSWARVLAKYGSRKLALQYTANSSEADRKVILAVARKANWNVIQNMGVTAKGEGSTVHVKPGDELLLRDLIPLMYVFDRSTNYVPQPDLEAGIVFIWLRAPWRDPNAE